MDIAIEKMAEKFPKTEDDSFVYIRTKLSTADMTVAMQTDNSNLVNLLYQLACAKKEFGAMMLIATEHYKEHLSNDKCIRRDPTLN